MTQLTPDQQAQVEDRDRAARLALFAADDVLMRDRETAGQISALPGADRTRIVVEAALGYLIAQGLIEVRPAADWPQTVSLETPDHLRPDVDSMIRRHAELQAALRQRLGGTDG